MQWIWTMSLTFVASVAFASTGPARNSVMFNVVDFGARGDGVTLDTPFLQLAIDSCSKRGGTVLFPAGIYLTGSLNLKSNVTLRLEKGALILGSKNLGDYREHRPKIRSYNDSFLRYSLFYAEHDSNISITGEGTIDGQGKYFKAPGKEKPQRYMNRPYLLRFVECRNVRVENIRLQNSAMWMQHYLGCEYLTIRGITVFNHANMNNDMIDIDGCRNVIISDCYGDTDDDGIVLKSTTEKATENVAITNCVLSSHCNAIKTGTESIGGFRNISISNCVVKPSSSETVIFGKRGGISGISLTLVDGGVLDGVTISGIVMDGPEVPIFVRLGNRGRVPFEQAPKPGVGALRNVVISNVTATNVKSTGCSVTGLPGHDVENVTFNNLQIRFAGGVDTTSSVQLAEMKDSYPESTMWGMLPASSFFVRHATNVKFRDCTFSYAAADARPVFWFDDVKDVAIAGWHGSSSGKADAAVVLSGVKVCTIDGASFTGAGGTFVRLAGDTNHSVKIVNNTLSNVGAIVGPQERSGEIMVSGNTN